MVLRFDNDVDFRNWLEGQPREVAQVLAHRSATRVLPYVYDASSFSINSEDPYRIILKHIFRLSISAHMLTIGTNTLRKSAVEAAHVAHVAYAAAAHAASAAYASDVAYSSDVAYAGFVPNTAANAAASAADTVVWAPLSAEVERIEAGMRPADLVLTPLWGDAPRPEVVETKWQDMKAALLRDDPNWQFWIDFYEGILAGGAYAPARIALMDKVAQMPEELWKKPARDVNAHIAGMYEEFIRREYMRPETIRLDRDRVEFSATDDVEVDPDLLNRCVKMIQDREGERIRRNNELALSSPLVAIIERLERTANETPPSPLDLYDEAKEFIKDASAWVAKHPEDDNDLVSRYISDANKIAGLIYNSDDKVKEMDALMASKYAVMPEADSPEAKALIASVKLAIKLSVGRLKIGLEADWARLKSAIAAKLPLHLIRPWQYRLASRLLEIRAAALEGREFIMSRITVENLQQATEYMRITKDFSEPWLYWAGIIYVICRYLGQEKAGS